MSNNNPPIDYFDLISRYLSGNASDAEVQRLEEWVLASPENKGQFNAIKKSWMLSGLENNDQNIDVEAEWKATADQLFTEAKVVSMPKRSKSRPVVWLRLAAAAAVLAVASIWLFNFSGSTTRVVAQSEILEQKLPDGSQISLNQFASIKYDREFDGEFRKVKLKGDAFFDVARDESRPFLIETKEVEVEVLGTSFYVDSRDGEQEVQVIVKSGSVAVRAGGKEVILKPNESAVFDKQKKQLVKKVNKDNNYLAWQTKLLQFENATLGEVVFALNRQFASEVSLENPALASCEITATYNDKTLEAIVRIIEKTLNIQSRKEGSRVIFSGQGCE